MALGTPTMSKAVLPGIRMSNRTDRVYVVRLCSRILTEAKGSLTQ
jgi:hypothetical protein